MTGWLKQAILRIAPRRLIALASTFRLVISGDYLRMVRRLEENERSTRMLAGTMLHDRYGNLASPGRPGQPWCSINLYEARIYSQNGEDGILLYLFSNIGARDRRFIEFGIGDGRQCNTANLSLNFGWSGLLMDIDPLHIEAAQRHYLRHLGQDADRVHILRCEVTAENVNQVLKDNGITGDVDLLSIDIDGNDYWVWGALDVVRPRVVAIEYNASLGPTHRLTVPYDPSSAKLGKHPSGLFHGASLAALAALGAGKGYVLVGCESAGVNAFFVRRDLAKGALAGISVERAYYPHHYRSTTMSPERQSEIVQHMPFVTV